MRNYVKKSSNLVTPACDYAVVMETSKVVGTQSAYQKFRRRMNGQVLS